jgi:hypothetical protein
MLVSHAYITILNDGCRGLRDLEVTEELRHAKTKTRLGQDRTKATHNL